MNEILNGIMKEAKDTVDAVVMYGMENMNICDLRMTAADNLDVDADDATNEDAIEAEMERLNGECLEVCSKLSSLIDSVYPLDKLNKYQTRTLEKELKDLCACGASLMQDTSTYIRCVIASYALNEDNGDYENFMFAIENALESEPEPLRYSVLFGYVVTKGAQEEWLKFESDDLQEAVSFCLDYPSTTAIEHRGYVYVLDNDTGEIVDDTWHEWE